jgi:hypoxanthine phosphoribosyltransferase
MTRCAETDALQIKYTSAVAHVRRCPCPARQPISEFSGFQFTGLDLHRPKPHKSRDTVSMETVTSQGLEVLYSRQQIADRVAEMGAQISRDLNGEKLVMVGVLKGAAFFLVDLSRAIQAEATFDFVAVSSYGKGQRSSGAVKLIKDLDQSIEGKNVLVVEDILDTGLTLAYLRKLFLQQHPKSLRIATLLDKPSRRMEQIEADYVGFSIPNLFVIGYGMDFAERYRNLPDICLMPSENPE